MTDGIELLRSKAFDCVLLDLDLPEADLPALKRMSLDRSRPPLGIVAVTIRDQASTEIVLWEGKRVCKYQHELQPPASDRPRRHHLRPATALTGRQNGDEYTHRNTQDGDKVYVSKGPRTLPVISRLCSK